MTLQDLILSHSWEDIEVTVHNLYHDQNIDGFRETFEKLKGMPAEKSEMEIVLENIEDYYESLDETEEYVSVSGRSLTEVDSPDYGIEFEPWKNWLGMTIAKETLEKFTKFEIISHCLYEMTYISFDEKEIRKQLEEIKNQVEALENMTEEEKKANLISWEELKKEFDFLDPDSETE